MMGGLTGQASIAIVTCCGLVRASRGWSIQALLAETAVVWQRHIVRPHRGLQQPYQENTKLEKLRQFYQFTSIYLMAGVPVLPPFSQMEVEQVDQQETISFPQVLPKCHPTCHVDDGLTSQHLVAPGDLISCSNGLLKCGRVTSLFLGEWGLMENSLRDLETSLDSKRQFQSGQWRIGQIYHSPKIEQKDLRQLPMSWVRLDHGGHVGIGTLLRMSKGPRGAPGPDVAGVGDSAAVAVTTGDLGHTYVAQSQHRARQHLLGGGRAWRITNYKVVPPSYKLVYNPINYRYIYHNS